MAKDYKFKNAGVLRTGFEYQDLIGIEVLLNFYRDPELYHWVALEVDEAKVGKLDDVVASRKDNTFELTQVKFTVDPDKHFLDWDWLLHKKRKGTSLLRKWSDALVKVKALGAVHSAKLRTNRRPSGSFLTSLNNGFIDFNRISDPDRATLIDGFGSEAIARDFFKAFQFLHSQPLVDDLEERLRGSIVPTDTDDNGWLRLREQARRWATLKNSPEPNGKIRHAHLTQIITKSRPKPIPQDFSVPDHYQVPSNNFHKNFIERVRTGSRHISVLWGSPGRGKSTYLSFLLDSLRALDLPIIRHHYFLSLDESAVDRISFSEISNSLMDQIAAHYPDAVRGLKNDPNQLRVWLDACGKHFEQDGRRFYVVIDGLDHVWRERQNISPMEHLFNYLLPCPKNVFLLVGTQRVASTQLPLKLIQAAENSDWIEVPPMDELAVHAWLAGQRDAGRLLLRESKHSEEAAELSEVGKAFFAICKGNPLHLIYSFEALVRRGTIVTAEEITLLPSCPDGDIRKYYSGLWARLSANARKVLHLIAGSDFSWPADGLKKCAGALDEVDHLLDYRRTGLIPFHGSIVAYVLEQGDHQSTFQSALPSIIRWLEREAPEYWRWGWLWLMRAKAGSKIDLLTKTTREWVIGSLNYGWPADQIISILNSAEKLAFESNDYVRTTKLRSIRHRLENGQEYQIDRFHDFEECAVRTAKNDQQILNMADMLSSASERDVITLLRCIDGIDKDGIGNECCEELRKRVNLWITLRHRLDEKFFSLTESLIEALVEFGKPDLTNLLRFVNQFSARDRLYQTFLRHVVRTKNFEMADGILKRLSADKFASWRAATEAALVQIACVESIDLSCRINPRNTISPLLSCWYRLKGIEPPYYCNLTDLSSKAVSKDYEYGPNPAIERFLHTYFFVALDTALQAVGPCTPTLIGINRSALGWLEEATSHLSNAAFEIANNLDELNFGSIFLGMANLAPIDNQFRASEPTSAQYRAFRAVIGEIALDVHALRCGIVGASLVESNEFELARGSSHWKDEIWVEHELRARRKQISPSAVKLLVASLENDESNHVTQFNERASRWIDLAQLSVLYDLEDGKKYIARAANCIIGYGWRKDTWIFDVLTSIENMHQTHASAAQRWLEKLAPFIDQITTFTDGDETNHAPESFIDVVAKIKVEWLPHLYAHYVKQEKYNLAQQTLSAILNHADLTGPAAVALVGSLLESDDLHVLEKLYKEGHPSAGVLLRKQRQFLGIIVPKEKPPKKSKNSSRDQTDAIGWGGKPPDVKKIGPNQLDQLLRQIAKPKLGYMHSRECLVKWLKYWAGKQKGLIALRAIDDYFNLNENPHALEPLLDEAFAVSLRYEGKGKAYRWLVRAQIERRGWDSYWNDSALSKQRLELAAKYYKSNWNNFIHDTSTPPRYWEKRRGGIVIGGRRLVEFLLLVKQMDLAVKLTESMVEQVIEEVSDQPIPASAWL